jgi:hypothetical protein
MPVLTTTGPPAISDLASRLVGDMNAGRTARQTIQAGRATAFEWTTGLPMILARQVQASTVDGFSWTLTRVAPSGTPAAKVAEGAPKPTAVTITSVPQALAKYAGLANCSTEQALGTDALVPALASVIATSCLMAYDADCIAALAADAGQTAIGATWGDAINGGIAAVAGAGGSPEVLALSAADYAGVVQSPGPGYAMDPTQGVPTMWGLRIVMSGAIPAGTAYVLDPTGVMAVEFDGAPVAVVDPYSGLATNAVRLAVEWFAGFGVTSPGVVAEVTYTGTREGREGRK